MSLGERIKRALTHWGGAHRAFAREMENRGVLGGTYRSLRNYMNGATTPSMRWIEEAAAILEVSPDWLRAERGPMVPQDLGDEIGRENNPHRSDPFLGKLVRSDLNHLLLSRLHP